MTYRNESGDLALSFALQQFDDINTDAGYFVVLVLKAYQDGDRNAAYAEGMMLRSEWYDWTIDYSTGYSRVSATYNGSFSHQVSFAAPPRMEMTSREDAILGVAKSLVLMDRIPKTRREFLNRLSQHSVQNGGLPLF